MKSIIEKVKGQIPEGKISIKHNDYGEYIESNVIDSLGTELGLVGDLSNCPEDATWGRDLQYNYHTGFKVGIVNTLKYLQDNPKVLAELLKEANDLS